MGKIWNFFLENAATETFAFALGAVIVGIASYFRYRQQVREAKRNLATGLDTERVIGQLNLVVERDGEFVLRLFNLPGRTTVGKLFETNIVTQTYLRGLTKKTTLQNPVLPFEEIEGKNSLHEIFNHFACLLGVLPHPLNNWLFIPTCEDGEFLERKQIRCFLIEEKALERFVDWEFCQRVQVTSQLHSYRLIALHHIAKSYAKQREEVGRFSARQEKPDTVTRIMTMTAALPVALPAREHSPVDWTAPDIRKVLASAGVTASAKPSEQPQAAEAPQASRQEAAPEEEPQAPESAPAEEPTAAEKAPSGKPAAEKSEPAPAEEPAPEKKASDE